MHNRLAAALVAAALTLGGVAVASPALATPPEDLVCPALDSGKIDTPDPDPATVTVDAPAGKLISGYCVKAGPGFEMIVVDPPLAQVVVDHPTKDSVSHYSLTYVDAPAEEPDPVRVAIGLTYMMDCAPDPENTWRVRNPSTGTVTVSWRNAASTLTGTHDATPGDSFFGTPRGTETMIITWGGGDTGIIAGSQTKASGNDVPASDVKCTGPQPETKVEATEWAAGEYGCDDTTVAETRTVTTTTYSLVDNQWVGTPVAVVEERVRDLTAEEIDALFCPGPQPEDDVVTSEWAGGAPECGDTTVLENRTVTTTSYVLDGETWVAGRPVVVFEERIRDLTVEEIAELDCPVPPTPEEPEVLAYTGGSTDVLAAGTLAAALLSALGVIAVAAGLRRRV